MATGIGWRLAFLFVVVAGIPASIYHAMNDRWGNALMAAGAVTAAIVLYATGRRTDDAPEAPSAEPSAPLPPVHVDRPYIPPARGNLSARLNGAILAGFVATIVLTLALIPGYILAGALAQQDGNDLERWLYGLTENSLTDGVFDIPIGAISLNLIAGLAWAFVYAVIVEPRLSGPGWRKGMLFSLAPWLLSLVVFFPLAGAGFFGVDLDAGPLPALGNLILHLIYGAALGAMYAVPEVSPTADRVDDARAARWENDGIAAGLLVGLLIGIATGGVLGMFVDSASFTDTGILLIGGALGAAFGGMLGAFAGLGVGGRRETL